MKLASLALALVIASASQLTYAHASEGPSEALVGSVAILVAPAVSVVASATGQDPVAPAVSLAGMGSALIVTGIADTGKDTVEVLADAASGAGKVSVKVARSVYDTLGLSVGTTLNVVAQSTGTALVASGKVLAFVPNAAGQALLQHARVPGESPATEAEAQQ